MKIFFFDLEFEVIDGKIYLTRFGVLKNIKSNFVEVQIAGENKNTHLGVKMPNSSEGGRLFYCSHKVIENQLEIVQCSKKIETTTVFRRYADNNTLRIYTQVKNISETDIILEEVSAFVVYGLDTEGIERPDKMYFTRFYNSHRTECQPHRYSFEELGFLRGMINSQKSISFANIGSWSTKTELPQGIIENGDQKFLMFQIESNAGWYYEISDRSLTYYLYLGGLNATFGGWEKRLAKKESYRTVNIAISFGNSVGQVVGEMTKYRRQISGCYKTDEKLPVIFNEYMHLSWDSPTEEKTKKYVPVVARTGTEYYVIDCGWHNEEDGDKIYPYVGQWKESKVRFPNGIRKITDYIRSFGMKAGLWIEPEIVGIHCQEMLDYYDETCFMQRAGKRIAVMDRYFLDFRNKKVRSYMSETIRRMIKEYGAEYIKFDYNQDCGIGTDYCSFCASVGLEECAHAFLEWTKEMTMLYPNVLFEGCASGGLRMDYKTLSVFSLVSTSDQTDYLLYPYIVGNILSAVIPEQAAVWSYPVNSFGEPNSRFEPTRKWVRERISENQVVLNMINGLLGRMHLASHLELLTKKQFSLVSEGVEYYKSLSEIKKEAVPYFPQGFSNFGSESVVAGLKKDNTIYVAVWNLKKEGTANLKIEFEKEIENVKIGYPKKNKPKIETFRNQLTIKFENSPIAVFLEIEYRH